MDNRNRGIEATAADDEGAEHHDSEESEEESSLSHPWIVMGPEHRTPLCALCKTWLAHQQHPEHGAVCNKCKGDIDEDLKVWYWRLLTRSNGSLVSHEIRRLVAGYIWGKEADASCYCGLCQGRWLADGWICSGD